MALDRFVYFTEGSTPSKDDVKMALEDYLGGLAKVVEWDRGRWYAVLKGDKSQPTKRFEAQINLRSEEGRYFEVVIGGDGIDVITRLADEVTNNIAHGFASFLARYWSGTYDPEI